MVIEKTTLVPSRYSNLPDHVTQDAYVGNGSTDKWDGVAEHFNFRTVDPADVDKVLMTTSKGTCWVDGNP